MERRGNRFALSDKESDLQVRAFTIVRPNSLPITPQLAHEMNTTFKLSSSMAPVIDYEILIAERIGTPESLAPFTVKDLRKVRAGLRFLYPELLPGDFERNPILHPNANNEIDENDTTIRVISSL
jgi:hypothetical protein